MVVHIFLSKMGNFDDKINVFYDFCSVEKVFIQKTAIFNKKRLQMPADSCIIVQVDYSEDARGCRHARPICHGRCVELFSRSESIISRRKEAVRWQNKRLESD